MSPSKIIASLGLMLLSALAQAENIYRHGTQGYELASFASTVLPPSVTPYFIMAREKWLFAGQIDSQKASHVLSASSQAALQKAPVAVNERAAAFAKYELNLPEGANRRVCKVVFVDPKRATVGSTLMHELMHCRIGSAELNADYRAAIMKVAGLAQGVPAGAALSMFEEILARAMSLSYIVNEGIKQDREFFETRLNKPYPYNPGPYTMPRVLHICLKKGACSVDAGSLAATLLADEEFRTLLARDFVANAAFNKAVGFE